MRRRARRRRIDEARADELIAELKRCPRTSRRAPQPRRTPAATEPADEASISSRSCSTLDELGARRAAGGSASTITSLQAEARALHKGNETTRLLRELARLGASTSTAIPATFRRSTISIPKAPICPGRVELDDDQDERRARVFEFVDGECDLEHRRRRRRRRRPLTRAAAPAAAARSPSAAGRRRADAEAPVASGRRASPRGRPPEAAAARGAKAEAAAPNGDAAGHDPRRSRPRRPADQPGRRTGHQPGHADPARARSRRWQGRERRHGPRRSRTSDARDPGKRDGDPRPAGASRCSSA